MSKGGSAIDIADMPDLPRIAEDVARTGRARVLRRNHENLAVLARVRAKRRPSVTHADYEAALAAAGSWKDFDVDGFLRANTESRSPSRPRVEL